MSAVNSTRLTKKPTWRSAAKARSLRWGLITLIAFPLLVTVGSILIAKEVLSYEVTMFIITPLLGLIFCAWMWQGVELFANSAYKVLAPITAPDTKVYPRSQVLARAELLIVRPRLLKFRRKGRPKSVDRDRSSPSNHLVQRPLITSAANPQQTQSAAEIEARGKRDVARAIARRADRIAHTLYLTPNESERWQQVKSSPFPVLVDEFQRQIYRARGIQELDAKMFMLQVGICFNDLAVRDPKTEEKWWGF